MTEKAVLYEQIKEHIALITINRPKAMNSVNGEVAQLMDQYVKQTEADDSIWVVILRGAGDRAFCAGADLKAISMGKGAELRSKDGGFAGFVYQKRTKPWIAAVGGFALAGGMEIAIACDMIVASEKANFGLPEVTRGIIAAAGGMFRLPKLLPKPIAMELIATGKRLSAERALHFGMINKLVPHAEYLDAALALAEEIVANAPLAVKESLMIARAAEDLTEEDLIQRTLEANMRIFTTEDAKEGPLAFVEKRKPVWKGK